MTNTPSPTDEDRELIEHDVAWLRERGFLTEKGSDEEIFYRIADRLESLLSDRAKLEEALRTLKAIALNAPDDEEPQQDGPN